MSAKNDKYYHRFKRARKQRLGALKAAFKIIDLFAIPTLSPDLYGKYLEVKEHLIKRYSERA